MGICSQIHDSFLSGFVWDSYDADNIFGKMDFIISFISFSLVFIIGPYNSFVGVIFSDTSHLFVLSCFVFVVFPLFVKSFPGCLTFIWFRQYATGARGFWGLDWLLRIFPLFCHFF